MVAGDTGSGARWASVSGSSDHTIAGRPAAADQREKYRAPAERGLQHAADQRRDQRRQRHDRAISDSSRPDARAVIQVAHHGARQHDAAGAAERLQRSAPRSASRSRSTARRPTVAAQ